MAAWVSRVASRIVTGRAWRWRSIRPRDTSPGLDREGTSNVNHATLHEARAAKTKVLAAFGGDPSVVGVGITRIGEGYGVKLNLQAPLPPTPFCPETSTASPSGSKSLGPSGNAEFRRRHSDAAALCRARARQRPWFSTWMRSGMGMLDDSSLLIALATPRSVRLWRGSLSKRTTSTPE